MVANEGFLREQQEHLKWNSGVYLVSVVLAALASTFGDMGVVVPSLLLKLEAPGWLVSFPMVATMSVAYLPVIAMGWWLRDSMARKPLYAWTCVLTLTMMLVILVPLYAGASREVLLWSVFASTLMYSLASGVTVLPCWDLFARVIAERERARLVSLATGVSLVCAVASGAVGGWLLSPQGPFAYPLNYAAALTLFLVASALYVVCICLYREPRMEAEEAPRETFKAYAAGVVGLVVRDAAFRWTIFASCVGLTVVSIGPVALSYAMKERGFDPGLVGWLVGLKACMGVPVVLVSARLSKRVTAQHICVMLAGLVGLGLLIAPLCWGAWQLVPLLMVGQSISLYSFSIVAVLRHAGSGQTHRHLTAFYSVGWVFGLVPLGVGWLMDFSANGAMLIAAGLAGAAGWMFWRTK